MVVGTRGPIDQRSPKSALAYRLASVVVESLSAASSIRTNRETGIFIGRPGLAKRIICAALIEGLAAEARPAPLPKAPPIVTAEERTLEAWNAKARRRASVEAASLSCGSTLGETLRTEGGRRTGPKFYNSDLEIS